MGAQTFSMQSVLAFKLRSVVEVIHFPFHYFALSTEVLHFLAIVCMSLFYCVFP